jgi:hypothetical protein
MIASPRLIQIEGLDIRIVLEYTIDPSCQWFKRRLNLYLGSI